jgi:hypothetical protein
LQSLLIVQVVNGGPNSWTQISRSNIEDWIILADNLKLHDLYDYCIIWVLEEIKSKFSYFSFSSFSKEWRRDYPEYYDEIYALYRMMDGNYGTRLGEKSTFRVFLQLNDFVDKVKKIKRFQGLKLVLLCYKKDSKSQEMSRKIKSFLGRKEREVIF